MEVWITLGVIAVIAFIVIAWGIGVYNSLVTLRNRYENAYSQIDVQLQRRYDLIPNIVETAKGYMKHERETLEAVIQARNAAATASKAASAAPGDPGAMGQLTAAETGLTGAMGRFFALAESYPDLKADSAMTNVQEELSSTENKVAFSRQSFNDSVMQFNTKREIFPASMIAGMFNFKEASLFELDNLEAKQAPKVSF